MDTTTVQFVPWTGSATPAVSELTTQLRNEGFALSAHPCPPNHTSLLFKTDTPFCICNSKGAISLEIKNGATQILHPGDKAYVPAGCQFECRVLSNDGAYYFIGQQVSA